jgi:Leucine-rich repeat (LRR) protein
LLTTALVVAAAVTVVAVTLHRYRAAYDRLIVLGATIKFRGPGWARTLSADKPLPGIDDVTAIELPDGAADEASFPVIAGCLRHFPELKTLRLTGATISDAQSPMFASFGARLETLDLSRANVGDAAARHLRHMTRLRRLDLSGTRITDESLPALAELKALQQLNLDHTSVGNDGIARLGGLSQLRELNVADTGVTDEGVERLHALLPNAEIYDD